ncbi:Uncharacterised protein [Vibrio cholerae]|nr:Uncharacterised protein [Vibrio cholerae]
MYGASNQLLTYTGFTVDQNIELRGRNHINIRFHGEHGAAITNNFDTVTAPCFLVELFQA